ncbi:MAG: ABC transporter substrate-binding protein [Pegethrix bostrychoides GSE-TBD4-15B]|jgi:branched-chain amino acid transport system substrate-binding protein|uniref:ABC transporter substrate-binding protein n=1 Tax=Pegethrix bostrychoides GSE-TBD4-15B TaxID=2839662 RepID=A0A951P8D0_9CYAN|nr:ABC transporter substrate-binding protein [Pegethrix bostrychoides GSE-TBD4-15B]
MLATIEIINGDFEQGFEVILEIAQDGGAVFRREARRLPPAPDLPQLYDSWQDCHYRLPEIRRIIRLPAAQTTEICDISTALSAASTLETYLQDWFSQDAFEALTGIILAETPPQDQLRVIFQTENRYLQRLPWQIWRLFGSQSRAEFGLSAHYAPPAGSINRPVRILAILGDSSGINVKADRSFLENLPGAEVVFLVEPDQSSLSDQLWDQPWDILFFAGHSTSDGQGNHGEFRINAQQSLSIQQLKFSLRQAIQQGLKLAIFNSCDGLGLAKQLTALRIPQMIVMREPVPDQIAQEFLKRFLYSFSNGTPFYLAVREARERLESLEQQFPGASWLPVICQNPAEPRLVWPSPDPILPPQRSWIARWFEQLSSEVGRLYRARKPLMLLGLALLALAAALLIALKLPLRTKLPSFGSPFVSPNVSIDVPKATPSDLLSLGERSLMATKPTGAKQLGITAYANQDWPEAIRQFEQALSQPSARNSDPESLIYLNNAIAALKGNPIQIATAVPLTTEATASYQGIAQEMLRGVAMAQTQANCGIQSLAEAMNQAADLAALCQGGIQQRLLQVQIANDKNNLETTDLVAAQLAVAHNLAVVGHYTSRITEQAAALYAKTGIVIVSPSSTSVKLSGLPYLFRTATNDAVAAQTLASYATQVKKLSRFAVANVPGDPFSDSLTDEFRKHLRSRKLIELPQCNLTASTFSSTGCVQAAIQAQAEALLLIPTQPATINLALELAKANATRSNRLMLLAGNTLYSPKTLDPYGEEAAQAGLTVAITWHRRGDRFEAEAEMLFGTQQVNWRTAMSYDAVNAICQGLKTTDLSKSLSQSRNNLKEALSSNLVADGAAGVGTVEFDAKGDRRPIAGRIGLLVRVEKNINSEVYDFKIVQ